MQVAWNLEQKAPMIQDWWRPIRVSEGKNEDGLAHIIMVITATVLSTHDILADV